MSSSLNLIIGQFTLILEITINLINNLTIIMVVEFSNNVVIYKTVSGVHDLKVISFKPTKHTVGGI